MKKSKIALIIVGLIVLSILIYKINPSKIISTFQKFNLFFLPLILVVFLIQYILAGLNIWILAKPFKKLNFFQSVKYVFFTLFYSSFTPGKIADFFMIFYLKENKINTSKSTIIILFDKIISLILKSILGILGALFILDKLNILAIGVPILMILAIISLFLLLSIKKFRNLIIKFILRKYSKIFKGFSRNLKKYLKDNKKELIYNTGTTLIKIIFETGLFFLLFLSFGAETNFIEVMLIFSLLSIITFVSFPIGISGLGIREAIGVIMYSTINLDPAVVFNAYIIRLLIVYSTNFLTFIRCSSELNLIKKLKKEKLGIT